MSFGTSMNFDSILIITYGRSGSTLLQGILNGIPGCVIRGENYNLFYNFFQGYKKIEKIALHAGNQLTTEPWYGAYAYTTEAYLEMVSGYAKETLLAGVSGGQPVTCYGFKEIRYINVQENIFEYLDFLTQVFPKPAFLFNTRNLDSVMKSGWWAKKNEQESRQQLVELERSFASYCSANSNCYQISYEDVINFTRRFEKLYEFLGAEYDKDNVRRIMAVPHSYNTKRR